MAFFLVELLMRAHRGWPRPVWRAFLPCLTLFILPLPGALRLGLDWAGPPLVERLCVLGLALAGFWYFRGNRRDLGALRAGLVCATAVTCALGLAQALNVQLLPSLTAGDQRSALFGNVNMAAEFLGFALLALLVLDPPPLSRALALGREALLAYAFVELFFLASRSALLAVGAAVIAILATGRLRPRRLGVLLAAALLGGVVFAQAGARMSTFVGTASGPEHLLRPEVQEYKRDSSTLRLAAWEGTIALLRDHPAGVGLGNFPDAFIPYLLERTPAPSETLYFRSPHDEGLRLMAEGGILALPLALGLGFALGRRLWRDPLVARGKTEAGALLIAGTAFFSVEAIFQFPLDVAPSAAAIALLFGLGAACLDPQTKVSPRRPLLTAAWVAGGLIAAGFVGSTAVRVARSEWRFVNARGDRAAPADACRLNPRNLPACVTAAWLAGRAGDASGARHTLERVLERSPYYFPAIKLLGEQALAAGERQAACRYLWIYDEFFARRTTVHRHLGRYCTPEEFAAFWATIPMPHYGSFPFAPQSGPEAPAPTGSSR